MLVSSVNDVRVYNLSAGKSLPEWLTDRKRRKLQQTDSDVRRRIELIQDFSMPDVSSCITMSPDQRYIFAAGSFGFGSNYFSEPTHLAGDSPKYIHRSGTYKPRLRCYEVGELSLKFERCVDSEIVKMMVLSDGYEKLVLLEDERYIELHTQQGHYFRVRMPRFGRDLAYYAPAAEVVVCASGSDIYRLNLEQGRFMQPMESCASSTTCCAINPHHYLFANGTNDCRLEMWDLRDRKRASLLDCAVECTAPTTVASYTTPLHVSSVAWKDAMTMAVGTSRGEILLYDIRSSKPLYVKDTHNELAVKRVHFVKTPDARLVSSLDSKTVKLFNEQDGAPFATIEPDVPLNDLHYVEGSGLLFMATESPRMQTYYVPALGPAPKWCSFLDNITEELEEQDQPTVFDDYKFVTTEELEALGLSNLIGTNLLRAYMHGYFIDARLYNKTRQVSDPFAYDQFRKNKLKEKLDAERRAHATSLNDATEKKKTKAPRVNKELAARLLLEQTADQQGMKSRKKVRARAAGNLLQDDRFSSLFTDRDFQVDMESDEWKMLNPALGKIHEAKEERHQLLLAEQPAEETESENDEDESEEEESGLHNAAASDDEVEKESDDDKKEESEGEDDEKELSRNAKKRADQRQKRQKGKSVEEKIKIGARHRERQMERRTRLRDQPLSSAMGDIRLVGLDPSANVHELNASVSKSTAADQSTVTLADRLANEHAHTASSSKGGKRAVTTEGEVTRTAEGMQIEFKSGSRTREEKVDEQKKKQLEARKKVRRNANEITKHLPKQKTGHARGM